MNNDLAARIHANEMTSYRVALVTGGSHPYLEADDFEASRGHSMNFGNNLAMLQRRGTAPIVVIPSLSKEALFDAVLSYLQAKMGAQTYAEFVSYVNGDSRASIDLSVAQSELVELLGKISDSLSAVNKDLRQSSERSAEFWSEYNRRVEELKTRHS